MEDLIGAIIPLLAVVGWLFSTFKKDEADKEPTKKVNRSPKPTPTPSGSANREMGSPGEVIEQQTMEAKPKIYYGKKQEQIDRLKEQVAKKGLVQSKEITQDGNIHDAIKNEQILEPNKKKIAKKSNLSINKQITKKGLAQSVIMAEVLGSPRSLKPYRNVMQSRRK